MKRLKLKYQLTKMEIEETLLCLDWKLEGKFKSINLVVISILGVIILIAYAREPEQFYLFFILLIIILLLFYLWYGPQRRRRKTAEKIASQGGNCQIVIGDNYIKPVDGHQKAKLKVGKLKFYNSDNMYILKVDREIFAIPKRVLGKEEEKKLIWLAKTYQADIVNIEIKGE